MIVSHRTPAVGLISAGVFLAIASCMLPVIISPGTPHGIYVAAHVMFWSAIPLFTIGCCIFARGNGYPFWLGIFGLTLVGLAMLMLLPDRYPEPDNDD